MAAQIVQFNTEQRTDTRWWPYSGDVGNAYGTEDGRKNVLAWWLMEQMALWSSGLQSVKAIIPAGFNITQSSGTDPNPSGAYAMFGFATRASYAETGPVEDGGLSFPTTFYKSDEGNVTTETFASGIPWDDLPESSDYPGFYEGAIAGWSSTSTRLAGESYNFAPGTNIGVPPTVIYSLDPGKEFFLFVHEHHVEVTDSDRTLTRVWGLARMQEVSDQVQKDGSRNGGWFYVDVIDDLSFISPIANTFGNHEYGTFMVENDGLMFGLDRVGGYFNSSFYSERYFAGAERSFEPAHTRWRSKLYFLSGSGLPLGSTGDLLLTGEIRHYDQGIGGHPLYTQRKYKGNIYLCLGRSLFWRIS